MKVRRLPRGDAGFTLVELIVVLAVLALVLGLVTAARPRLSGLRLEGTARAMAAGLRAARADAMLHGVETAFVIDGAARAFGRPGAMQALPQDVSLDVTAAASERRGLAGAFRFYPNGRSSGGALALAAGGREARIDVDWLTGEPWVR